MNPQTEAISAALKYIEGHLCDSISLEDIANAAGYSLFHFIRIFNKLVSHTPYDYLIRRRLSHAAGMLLETDAQVLDIALACQFDSHEGFTRAFGRLFRMPPTTWRENHHHDQRYVMPLLDDADLSFRQLPDLQPPELIPLDKLCLAGWMYFQSPDKHEEESIKKLFKNTLSEYTFPVLGNSHWEVRMLPTPQVQQEMGFLGVRVMNMSNLPDRFVIKIIRKGEFLRYSHKALTEHREEALKFLYHTFLPKSGLCLKDPVEIEYHGDPPAVFLPVEKATQ